MAKRHWRQAESVLSSWLPMVREDDRPLSFRGGFIPAVPEAFMLRHTQPGDWVWDPFAGSGTTEWAGHRMGRRVILSDLTPDEGMVSIRRGDARQVSFYVDPETGRPTQDNGPGRPLGPKRQLFEFDLIILHPPYFDTIEYSEHEDDLSRAPDLEQFYREISRVGWNVHRHLRRGGYLALVCGDVWHAGRLEPLAFNVMGRLLEAFEPSNGRLKAIQVKNIEGNRHGAGQAKLMLSRFFGWGAVKLAHEYLISIEKREPKGKR